MAATKVIVYLFTILVPLAIVFSEDAPSVPSIPGLPNLPSLPNFPGSRASAAGSASEDEGDDSERQDRFFFSIPRLTSCNYTSEPGRTCRSCSESLTCLSSNVGILKSCRGIFRYCNEGRCSLYQGSACTNSTG